MLNSHDVAVAIQDWTKSPHKNKIWVFNSIDKGWEEVPKEEIGKLFLVEGKEHYSFICTGKDPIELKCANGIYFMPGISIEKFKTMIEMSETKYFYCPSLASKDNYASFRLKNGDNKKQMEYLCQKGFLYDNRNDAVAAVKALLGETSVG